MNTEKSKLPNFDGYIVLMFPKNVTVPQIENIFGKQDDLDLHIYDDMIEITYKEVKNFLCWDANDLLTRLFSSCDISTILLSQKELEAKVLVDITFHHYGKYPALVFEGKNMGIVHLLHADISIDPY